MIYDHELKAHGNSAWADHTGGLPSVPTGPF